MSSNSALDLYATFEDLIPFEAEQRSLHNHYLDLIRQKSPTNLLDVGCGGGKFLLLLKQHNIAAKGIDLSPAMVQKALNLGVEAEAKNLLEVSEQFSLITAIFDVANYLNDEDLTNFFDGAHNALTDNGYFLFDTNTLFGFEEIAVGSLVLRKNNIHATVESYFEDEKLFSQFTLFLPDKTGLYAKESGEIVQYFHNSKIIQQALKKSGFKLIDKIDIFLYGETKSDKTLWIAQKISIK